MRALVWISEGSWEDCVDRARELLPPDAEVTILHVADSEVEHLVDHPGPERLGRHRPPPGPGGRREPGIRAIAESEARTLLDQAAERFGRPVRIAARRGRIEREVLRACADAEMLVLARDGEPRLGPRSLGHATRFVVDHAGCQVLLVWTGKAPAGEVHWPPHLR